MGFAFGVIYLEEGSRDIEMDFQGWWVPVSHWFGFVGC